MTSTPVSNLAKAQAAPVLISKTGLLWAGIIAALMVLFHSHFVWRTIRIGINDADWSHVLIIPLISIYYIHLHRHTLMATPRRVCRWGLPFIIAGIAGYVLGIYPIRNDMAQGYSMIMTLFGVVLLLLGPAMMRTLWFPILFLVFAVKVSDAIWSVVASKMQGFAASGSVMLINLASPLTDMYATLTGSTIHLDYVANGIAQQKPMNVAEACAGMRMLMAFLALGVALAFLFPRSWWQRLIMVALAAPIAIFINALRVAVLGWLHLIDPQLAQGDSHLFVGMLMLIPAAGLLMLVGWCLDKVVIREGKPPRPPAPLPFDHDPQQIHFDPPIIAKGAGLGAAVVVLLGLGYILLINHLAKGEVITWLGGAVNTALLVIVGVLFVAGLVLTWRATRRGVPDHTRLALSQGIVGGLLIMAMVGKTTATNTMGVALSKKPIELRHGFALSFPKQAGDWQLLHHDPKLQKDIEDELGTKEYFNRFYINNAAGLTPDNVKVRYDETPLGKRLAGWDGVDDPGDFAKVHIAYYTGMLDTVPHVPDKCWIVAGQQLVYRAEHTLKLDRDDYRPDPDHPGMILAESSLGTTVRLPSDEIKAVVFSGADEEGRVTTALYFFLANGDAIASSHQVRFSFNLQDRYSYYCKVEVMFPTFTNDYLKKNPGASPEDVGHAVAENAQDLLSDLLPEVMACLPDWTEVRAGTYPGGDTND